MTLAELNEIKKNYKVLELAVDFINPSYNISRAKHLDNARYLVCTLTENGIPRKVKADEVARIRLQKPDRTHVYNDCAVLEDGRVFITLTEQILAVEGNALCDIQLVNERTEVLYSTKNFIINIDKTAVNNSIIASSDEFDALNKLIATNKKINEELKANEKVRQENENERIENENERKENETDRQNSEAERVNAENTRKANENVRIGNENTRKTNENIRNQNENTRISNEDTRKTNETSRQNAEIQRVNEENTRKTNENTRISNENTRKESETGRVNAENQRVSAENTRISNENTRNSNENIRKANENTRKANETVRQNQESDRQTNTATAISNAEKATKKANEAADDLQHKLDTHHFVLTEDKDVAGGVPGLDSNKKVPVTELYEATTSSKGITQLTDSVTSTSTTTAATPKSIKTAYDKAVSVGNDLKAHNSSSTAHEDIRTLISELHTKLITIADSDDVTLDQLSEIVAYIKNNKSLIDGITTSKVNVADIIDSLTSTATNKPLSAKQGKVLNDLITALTTVVGNKVDKVSGKGLSANDYTTTEKNKLKGIANGAEVNQNAFSNIVVGSVTISADSKTDTFTIAAGNNITLTADAANDKLTITAKDTTYSLGTASVLGLTKLYTATGSATDGTMTQKAATEQFAKYLPLTGGTITGRLMEKEGSIVHYASAGSGSNGYIKFGTVKINSTYDNSPIIIELTKRGTGLTCTLHLSFSSENNTNPSTANFYFTTGPDYNCYIHHSATGTWDLYVQKAEAYDSICVLRYNKSPQMDGVDITWTDTLVSAVPSGSVKATIAGQVLQARRLETARKINGVAFDGQSDITISAAPTANSLNYVRVYNSSHVNSSSTATVNDLAKQYASVGMVEAATDNPTGAAKWITVWNYAWTNNVNTSWVSQIALGNSDNNGMWYRTRSGTIVGTAWARVLDSANYTSYTVTKTGSGASGTWGINVNGNSATATKLQTARKINGVAFDGTGDITISAAPTTHNHGLLHSDLSLSLANTTTDNGWSMLNASYNGFLLKSIRTQQNAPSWIYGNYASGIAFGGGDTHGIISVAYNTPGVKFAGGNGTKPVWNFSITGNNGSTYNLANFSTTSHTHNYAGSPSAGGAANAVNLPRVAKSCTYKPGLNKLVVEEFTQGSNYNLPSTNWYHIYTAEGADANYATQLALGMTTEAVYYRNCNNNTWGSWRQLGWASHSHNYLPLSGGTMTGIINTSQTTATYLNGNRGTAIINSTASAGAFTMLAKLNSQNGYFTHGVYQNAYMLYYTAKTTVDAGTNSPTRTVKLLDENGNTEFTGTVSAKAFSGAAATQSAAGLMSAADKKKLDGIAEGANKTGSSLTVSELKGATAWSATEKYFTLNSVVRFRGSVFAPDNGYSDYCNLGAKDYEWKTIYGKSIYATTLYEGETKLSDKYAAKSHSHNYAGSSSAGGSANSAVKLDSSAGSATQPVYFSGGKPVACTYTLGKSVPSNAVFTDTNTWRGITDSLTSSDSAVSLSAKAGKSLKDSIDTINGKLDWILVNTVTGTASITIPSGAKELFLCAYLNYNGTTWAFNNTLLIEQLPTSATEIYALGGYHESAGDTGSIFVNVSRTKVSLRTFIFAGTNYTSSAKLSVRYKK